MFFQREVTMKERIIMDTHVHVFPDKLKGKVLPKLGEIAKCPYHSDGTVSDTLEKMKGAGVAKFLCLHIATNPKQQKSVNNFAVEVQNENPGVLCFGSVHPDSEEALSDLKMLKEKGIRGVKFHPDYQEFMVDDSRMEPIYAACEELGLIVAFHAGWDPLSPELIHCRPEALRKVVEKHPELKIIAAHLGGMKLADEVIGNLCHMDNVWFDTGFASCAFSPEDALRIIKAKGVDKIIFATDTPWSTVEAEREFLEGLDLSDEELDKIFYKNAFRLLGIKK